MVADDDIVPRCCLHSLVRLINNAARCPWKTLLRRDVEHLLGPRRTAESGDSQDDNCDDGRSQETPLPPLEMTCLSWSRLRCSEVSISRSAASARSLSRVSLDARPPNTDCGARRLAERAAPLSEERPARADAVALPFWPYAYG